MKVIVTGGAGYIGSHTVVELVNAGYDVVLMDDLSNSSIDMLDKIGDVIGKKICFIKVDLSDSDACAKAFKTHVDAKAVIHFAAFKSVPESISKPNEYYRNNIGSLLNVTTSMEKYDMPYLVFSSSCTVYGDTKELPVKESTPMLPPNSPYGHTKQLGEHILKNLSSTLASKIKSIALRYFNPVGAHPSGMIGELPNGVPGNLMPFITQTAAGFRQQLSVFGDDYNTPDGTAVRDYIHVVDLASAHVKALDYMQSEKSKEKYQVFNVGTGNGSSVLEVIQSFERTSGEKLNYKIAPRREGDIAMIYADAKYTMETINWSAKYNLDDMTGSAWAWEKKVRGL